MELRNKYASYYCSVCGWVEDVLQFGEKFGGKCSRCGKDIFNYVIRIWPSDNPAFGQCNVDVLYRDNPRWSDALGINPKQEAQFKKRFPKLDLTFDKEGRCLVKNRAHKKEIMKARGYWDDGW